MIIDPYGLFQMFLAGIALEYTIVQTIKYRQHKEEIGYIWLILFGIEILVYTLSEAHISQGAYPILGEIVTRIQHTSISLFPIILTWFWYFYLKDPILKKGCYFYLIFSSIQIFTLWFNLYNIYGDFVLKHFNEGTIFEINQWGYLETGIFGYLEVFMVFSCVIFITIYLFITPKTKSLEKEKKYFYMATGIFIFAILNDVLVLWLEGYKMIFLNGLGIIIMIYSLNQFLIIREKKLEKSIQQFEQIIKESEEKYRNLFESTPISILLLDEEGIIVDCNPASEKLTKYTREELIGTKFYKLGKYPEEDLFPTVLKRLKRYLEAAKLPPLEIQLFRKDESIIWIQIHASLVKFDSTSYVQIIGFNISNRKKAESIVEEEVQKLKELDTIRKDLISRVSHELKTPIMSISGASELLRNVYPDQIGKDATEMVRMIERGGNRLKVLVERLLDISRIDYDRLKLDLKSGDLSAIVKECAEDLELNLVERKIMLHLNLPDELVFKFDHTRIEQVITNLISNAIKNTPPKGRIDVSLERNENWAIIKIQDTGVGLTKEEMDKLFTRFGKIERTGPGLEFLNIQGSGLGLYISKRIIDLHEGKIFVQSEGRNKGTVFEVKIPI